MARVPSMPSLPLQVLAFFPMAASATQLGSQAASSVAAELAAPEESKLAFRGSAPASAFPAQDARGTRSSLLEIEVAIHEGMVALEDHSFHMLIVASMLLIIVMMGLTVCVVPSDEHMRARVGGQGLPSKRTVQRKATFGSTDVVRFHVNLRELNAELAAGIHSNMGLGMNAILSKNRRSMQIMNHQDCLGSVTFNHEVCLSSMGKRIRLVGDAHDDHVLTMNGETAVKFDPASRRVQVYACRDHHRYGEALVHGEELEVTVYPGHDPIAVLLLSLNVVIRSSQDRHRQVLLSSNSL